MDHILEFFHSEHDEDLLYFEIHILQYWLVVAPPSKFNIVYTVLFHKYVGSNVSVKSCMSHFSMFVPTKATVKLANGNTAHAQKLGLFYVVSLTVPLYIQWDQFIIVQVILPTSSNQVPSNFMLGFKRLRLNLLKFLTLLTLKVVLGDHPTILKMISTTFKEKLSKSTLIETWIFLSQLSVHFQYKISLRLFVSILVVSLLPD